MLTLRFQIFIAFLGFALILLMGVLVYSQASFENSFEHYVQQREIERNAELIDALRQHYQEHQNWNMFTAEPAAWTSLVNQFRRPNRNLREPRPENASTVAENRIRTTAQEGNIRPRANRSQRRDNRLRLILVDKKHVLISGKKSSHEHYIYAAITQPKAIGETIVGYVGTPINPELRDLLDTQFVDQQQKQFLTMTLLAFIAAFAFAIPLSILLTRKIKRLSTHVQALSQGHYNQSLNLAGRDEFSLLAQHLNHLGKTLAQSEESRKRWVADISHELRTPLSVLTADLDALEDGIREFTPETLARLQNHTGRLRHLINDLYELSLTDIGAMTYRKEPCELQQLVKESSNAISESFRAANLVFTTNLTPESTPIFADSARIQQLLLNLFHNSLNYTQAPGTVHVELIRKEDSAYFSIEDSAPGVSEEELNQLFNRLYRGEQSRNRQTGGAGLGLSICRNIVEAHSGTIKASQSTLGGVKISVRLPLKV
jgi:two-component system sensor histidine kinase BaeS